MNGKPVEEDDAKDEDRDAVDRWSDESPAPTPQPTEEPVD
jgi:hypothetical protein